MQANGVPEKVTIDKRGANKAAIDEINAKGEIPVVVRQVKYLNNIVEQDHRAVKRMTKPMLGFKSFQSAKNILADIELMHMIRKDQMMMRGADKMSFVAILCAGRINTSRDRSRYTCSLEICIFIVNATEPFGLLKSGF
jgi:transposase-like protein